MRILLFGVFFTASSIAFAANIYWISASPSNWNNPANWSASSGGASCGCTPTASDVAIFDGLGGANGSCILDISPSIGILRMVGYTDQIDLNGNNLNIVGLGAGNNVLNSGIILGSGTVNFTSSNGVSVVGTNFGVDVDFFATLTTVNGIFTVASSTMRGDVNVTAYSVLLNGGLFNGTVSFIKTGNSNDLGAGGNWFDGSTTIRNNSAGILRIGDVFGDVFNNSLLLYLDANANGGYIQVAYGAGTSTFFNGNVTVRSVDNGFNLIGINFGLGGGSSQLIEGATISDNPAVNTGFERGAFVLQNFTQGNAGSTTSQYLNIDYQGSPSSVAALSLRIANSTFNAPLIVESSNMDLNNSTFNGANNRFAKFQDGGDTNITGGNVFNGNVVFANEAGSSALVGGFMYIGTTAGNDFNGDLTFEYRNSFAKFFFGQHNSNDDVTTISGNISVTRTAGTTANETVLFCNSNFGSIVLDGNANQTISVFTRRNAPNDFYYTFNFNNVEINKGGGSVSFANVLSLSPVSTINPIVVSGDVTFTNGIVNPITTVYFNFLDGATAIGANNNSFVDGLVQKTGDDAFTFPVGDAGYYRPIDISAPATVSSVFSASYSRSNHGLGTVMAAPLAIISTCEYWTLNRVTGTDNVSVTLSWNQAVFCNSNYVTDPANLRVSRWGGASWTDLGNGGITGSASLGTVSSAAAVTAFGTFTLGSLTINNVLPVEFTFVKAEVENSVIEVKWQTASENDNDYFTVEHYMAGENGFQKQGTVVGSGTTTKVCNYSWFDRNPVTGQHYYRIKQTDFDGRESYSSVVGLLVDVADLDAGVVYPNPVTDNLYLDKLHVTDDSILEIIALTGRVVFRGNLQPVFNFEGQPSGVYTLIVYTDTRLQVYRVVKR